MQTLVFYRKKPPFAILAGQAQPGQSYVDAQGNVYMGLSISGPSNKVAIVNLSNGAVFGSECQIALNPAVLALFASEHLKTLTDDDYVAAFETMASMGGHFAQALADAALLGDSDNLARIKAAFHDLICAYAP